MKTQQKQFDIERVKEFCKRINNGESPTEALANMNTCRAYATPLRKAGLFWTEKNGTYKAVERIYTERYELFSLERKKFNNRNFNRYIEKQKEQKINSVQKRNSYKEYTKQATLFNQPKPKPTAPTMKAKKRELSFIQRVVKSLFKL
jgi:hypothetical protein